MNKCYKFTQYASFPTEASKLHLIKFHFIQPNSTK